MNSMIRYRKAVACFLWNEDPEPEKEEWEEDDEDVHFDEGEAND